MHVLHVASRIRPVALAALQRALRLPGSWAPTAAAVHPPHPTNSPTPPRCPCRTCGATPTTIPFWAAWDPPR